MPPVADAHEKPLDRRPDEGPGGLRSWGIVLGWCPIHAVCGFGRVRTEWESWFGVEMEVEP